MSDQTSRGRSIAMKTFLCIWILVVAVPILYTLFTFQSMPIAKKTSIDLLLILSPNFIPAIFAGSFLGPKLCSVGYLRSLGWQLLCALAWAFLFAIWLFILLFRHEILQVFAGSQTLGSILKLFSVRAIDVVGANCLILIPITLLSSGVTILFARRTPASA